MSKKVDTSRNGRKPSPPKYAGPTRSTFDAPCLMMLLVLVFAWPVLLVRAAIVGRRR